MAPPSPDDGVGSGPLPAVALALLALAALSGLWSTGQALVDGTGRLLDGAATPTVGTPTPMTPWVERVRAVLPGEPREGDLVVILPADAPPTLRNYVRYQLAYLQFPTRVDVAGEGEPIDPARYDGIVAPRGTVPPRGWRAEAEAEGLVLLRSGSPVGTP